MMMEEVHVSVSGEEEGISISIEAHASEMLQDLGKSHFGTGAGPISCVPKRKMGGRGPRLGSPAKKSSKFYKKQRKST